MVKQDQTKVRELGSLNENQKVGRGSVPVPIML